VILFWRGVKQEKTALQYLGSQFGVTVWLTPKFHEELAGEGVKNICAHARAYYPRMLLSRKRGRDNFKRLVRDCTSPVNVLTKERIEKFASRAQAYTCTYHHLQQEHHKLEETAAANEDQNAVVVQTTPAVIPK
jgi:hypothetical protein